MPSCDFSSRLVLPIFSYLEEAFGPLACERVASACGVPLGTLRNPRSWLDIATVEAVLASARAQVKDDDEFLRACAHRLVESYGPVLILLRALTVPAAFRQMARTIHVASRCSRYEVLEGGPRHVALRYTSNHPESRLLCHSRREHVRVLAELAGARRLRLQESACIARGDACCEYRLSWQEATRWLPVAIGTALGAAAGVAFARVGPHGLLMLVLPALGALLGRIAQVERTNRAALEENEEANEALREFAEQTKEARDEMLALTQRRESLSAGLEEQIAERTQTLRAVIEQVEGLRAQRAESLEGLSHGLRNPLATLRTQHRLLEECSRHWSMAESERPLLADLGLALDQIDRLLQSALASGATEPAPPPETVEVGPLAQRLRRQVEALVFGRDIRVEVRVTRDAPSAIRAHLQSFERIVDNLLTNAAKYTARGTVSVELDGTPGMLCIRIADTGCGIPPEGAEALFHPEAPKPCVAAPFEGESHGVGLSGVVRLLGEAGGRLEVSSRLGAGTTFCAYLPVEPDGACALVEEHPALVRRIVTLRPP